MRRCPLADGKEGMHKRFRAKAPGGKGDRVVHYQPEASP